MSEEIRKPHIDFAAIWAAEPTLAEWRLHCGEAMRRHTDETLRLIRQHAVTIAPEDDEASK
jgi:hypothetical protein